jgi:ribonuclease HI
MTTLKKVAIYTDGGCIGNPGPGGYGAVLLYGEHRKEISAGYKLTTNNRMELLACIAALELLKYKCDVIIYSDSKYVVDSFEKGWAKKWRANGWRRNKKDKAENPDLWERLLDLCEKHNVQFEWVKGHAGNSENERCDKLAEKAAKSHHLLIDINYEKMGSCKKEEVPYSLF